MARAFPTLPDDIERRVNAIKMASEQDPSYFDDPTCPYPDVVKQLFKPASVEDRIKLFNDEQDVGEAADTVLAEVQSTIEEMKSLEIMLKDSSESSDRIALYRAKTAMMEKWVSLKEKLTNLKAMSDFQRLVVGVLEEVMTKDQQQDVKNRLKGMM